MSTLVLSSAGSTAGSAIGGLFGPGGAAIGSALGKAAGTYAGNAIDSKIFGASANSSKKGARLTDLAVQSSAYGEMIPIVYGTVRLAGNIIWSQPIQEIATATDNTDGGGKGGGSGKVSGNSTTYSYTATLAIAICEGEIDEVIRVWADAKPISLNDGTYRLYKGSETQNPDSLIESIEGVGVTPAYRGLAYVVIENLPLGDFGNRIPNFTFEVRKRVTSQDQNDTPVEDLLTAMVMIPGSGEFVYDDKVQTKILGQEADSTWLQAGNKTRINQNNREGKADSLVSLDQLEATCSNLEWVAVVVTWFGDSLDAGDCIIKPGVEFQTGAITEPDTWGVGSYTRSTARQITLIDGTPRYGGTPSDASLLRYIREIKSRGYNVMFYPMFFMDVENKPWRGRVTGTASEVADFFTKTNGYNDFIEYYAALVKDDVDAFVIGSELIGLTSVQDVDDSFPAVDELVSLASSVKTTVGSGVKVTYAADWSEYHHDANGWYNLDPIWASSSIDFIGIDAYFPLTDQLEPTSGFDIDLLQNGWTSGEGYDWYYSDEDRTVQTALAPAYAWKNIAWWWSNSHVNPDMNTTSWVPESKKIWFTEFGFPSVDGASNQPNVFYDPGSSESSFPYHSKGRVDFRAQRNAIWATLLKWQGSPMIERMFLWTWDARPFPYWPDLTTVWADGSQWQTGHWVNGKLGLSTLGAIIADLSNRVSLSYAQIDVSRLNDVVEGYVLSSQITARSAIDNLRLAYFFDAVESNGVIKYIVRGNLSSLSLTEDDLIPLEEKGRVLDITRTADLELPQKVDVIYLNKGADYQTGNQHAQRSVTESVGVQTIGLPIVMTNQRAKNIAEITLYSNWLERSEYKLILPIKYAYIEPTDVIDVTAQSSNHLIRVTNTQFDTPGQVIIQGVAEDVSSYDFNATAGDSVSQTEIVRDAGDTVLHILDLPAFPSDNGQYIRYAASGQEEGWRGAVVFRSNDAGINYNQLVSINSEAVIGKTTEALAGGAYAVFDGVNSVTVNLYGDVDLESKSQLAILNGENAALIGSEIIQFTTATFVSEGVYTLSGLLRGRLGTEYATVGHSSGEDFVLLDNNVVKESAPSALIGLERLYKGVSSGHSLATTYTQNFTYNAVSLKPYSPVHILGSRDGSNNLIISWVRRARINGSWMDNIDVPIGEVAEEYEIDILDGESIVRTITGLSSTTYTYTATDQTTDFGSAQSLVDVVVYQISEIAGRGIGGEGSI